MSTDGSILPDDVEQLKAMIAARDAVIARREAVLLQRDIEIVGHRAVIAQKEMVITSLHDVVEQQQAKLERVHEQLARLLRERYGPRKERVDPNQLTLFTPEELAELIRELKRDQQDSVSTDDGSLPQDESLGAAKPKGHGRRPIPPEIPRETIVHELTEQERQCPCCGELRAEIGREVSEQLEFIPARLKAIRHERVRYACRGCEEHVVLAPKPPQPIDKGLPGPGLLANLIVSKYGDYLPLYRMEDILSRYRLLLRRSTLCDWVASMADLLTPLYDLLCQRVRQSGVIHTDDTSIKMLSEGQCQNCKFWTYIGDPAHPYVAYEFSLTRAGRNPSRFLEGFSGYLQADAFSGYDQIYAKEQVTEVACMAHCRRYWQEASHTDARRAYEALGYISRLYQLESEFEAAGLSGASLRDARQQHAVGILKTFRSWLNEEQNQVLPKSPIGQAFTYTLNQWEATCRYTDDGALQIDNNLAERMMKPPAILRKNMLFVGGEQGGHRAAILLSLVGSAKYCEVEPWHWLRAVLEELPQRLRTGADPPDLTDLLPDHWLKAHPEHRWKIETIRKKERQRSKQQKANKRKKR
ncbi:IS66 family transposase [Schlesneria sp. DSM 10557]|uniref:IS66 family transposase n=1 Tax=Schlesneria sp. DSM 10557 TaxID=3044399 RepID=UPI0035A178A5